MAALWPLSRIPQIDPSGDPYAGAQAFFYNPGTTTPQTTYADGGLGSPSPHNGSGAVVADGNGRFPAIFFSPTPGQYHQRVLDADGNLLFDDDFVDVYQSATYVPPSAGTTDPTLLLSTGDLLFKYRTGTVSGCVRANGRTIGSASSGASERANADTSALFQHLWTQDANLAVSGGRGGTAAGDFAANKTIALPDFRDRIPIGLGDMGNADANRIADALTDGPSTNTTLGATAGQSTHTLVASELPTTAYTATFTGAALAGHSHSITLTGSGGGSGVSQGIGSAVGSANTGSVSAGTPAGTVSVTNAGGDNAHTSLQPGLFATWYVKL